MSSTYYTSYLKISRPVVKKLAYSFLTSIICLRPAAPAAPGTLLAMQNLNPDWDLLN